MSRFAWVAVLAVPFATSAVAQSPAVPDLKGTWKGTSESVILGAGNTHHTKGERVAQMRQVPFTLVVDQQEGRRFSGTFSSPRASERVVAVVSRNGAIMMADDDGYTIGSVLAPNRIELCYLRASAGTRIASCTEMTKQ
jgi:hypothetical protein